jgi:large subunit ribosomal protein L25
MKTVSMSGSLRENVGKKDAKKNRSLGKIPCVLYGGKEQIHFTVEELPFSKLIFTPEVFLVELDINGKKFMSVLQDVQYHPVSDKVLHADFFEIFPDKPVATVLPVKIKGVSKGVLAGGKLHKKKRKIRVKGIYTDLPEFIELDITELNIGDSIRIEDIEVEKLELLDKPRDVVVSVKVTRVAAVEEEEAEEEGEEVPEGEEGAGEETTSGE